LFFFLFNFQCLAPKVPHSWIDDAPLVAARKTLKDYKMVVAVSDRCPLLRVARDNGSRATLERIHLTGLDQTRLAAVMSFLSR
jgi:hypothetical protein